MNIFHWHWTPHLHNWVFEKLWQNEILEPIVGNSRIELLLKLDLSHIFRGELFFWLNKNIKPSQNIKWKLQDCSNRIVSQKWNFTKGTSRYPDEQILEI